MENGDVFETIRRKFDAYYEKDYEDDEEEENNENIQIKKELVQVLKLAKDDYDKGDVSKDRYQEIVSDGLMILTRNTGSHVDLEILEDIIKELLILGIINRLQAKQLRENSPVSRWF